MTAFSERINQDLRKIKELSDSIGGRVKIKKQSGNPVNSLILEIDYPTAPSKSYPAQVQKTTEVHIKLLSRYPFQEPEATITTPISIEDFTFISTSVLILPNVREGS